jgi:hypothetical protein
MVTPVWIRSNRRIIVEVVPDLRKDEQGNYYWKGGKPINPQIPKWLVKITDKWLDDEYYPLDREFTLIKSMLDNDSNRLVLEAFEFKEKHNKANLKNPESRKIERIFGCL